MNLVGTITRDEARLLLSKELGRTITDDGEIVLLHTSDLADISGTPSEDVIYAGVFDLHTFDAIKVAILATSYKVDDPADKVTLDNTPSAPPQKTGMVFFNAIQSYASGSDGLCQFSGYKFNLKKQWDVATLGAFANGAGWAIASGINTHSSGTAEATYGYGFIARKYRVTIDISGVTAGSLVLSTTAVANIGTITADGLQTFEWDGDATDTALYLTPTADFDGGYDTTTLKLEVLNRY